MSRPLNEREMSACLAGLRKLQIRPGEIVGDEINVIATNDGKFVPPDEDFIDALCEALNGGEIEVSNGVLEDMAKAAAGPPER